MQQRNTHYLRPSMSTVLRERRPLHRRRTTSRSGPSLSSTNTCAPSRTPYHLKDGKPLFPLKTLYTCRSYDREHGYWFVSQTCDATGCPRESCLIATGAPVKTRTPPQTSPEISEFMYNHEGQTTAYRSSRDLIIRLGKGPHVP